MLTLRGCFLSLLIPLLASAEPPNDICNPESHFHCADPRRPCIPMEWMCDRVADCPNAMDEKNCHYLHECEEGQLMCRNGECVEDKFRCDGVTDCSDGTDEKGCVEMDKMEKAFGKIFPASPFRESKKEDMRREVAECSRKEYTCRGGQCITKEAKCDGVQDCTFGDDEENCEDPQEKNGNSKCSVDTVQCADGNVCVPLGWVCDGADDCDDGSDEAHCGEDDADSVTFIKQVMEQKKLKVNGTADGLPNEHDFIHGMNEALCGSDQFKCKGGKCIPSSLACNGVKDCPMGDDEGDKCVECASKGRSCMHSCKDTPLGYECECRQGYDLGEDGFSCEKENECLKDGMRCSQHCDDTEYGYECKCEKGYELSTDKHTCHLDSSNVIDGLVYVSLTSEIRSMPLFAPQTSHEAYVTVASTNHHGTTKNLAYSTRDQRLFAAIEPSSHEGILAFVNNGSIVNLRENVTGINYVAMDWVGGNIIFTARHPSPNPGIYICTSSGLFCRLLIEGRQEQGKKKQNYRGLAVNPARGIIAWIDLWGVDHRIMTASLDGSDIRSVVESKLDYPSALAFDHIKNDLYFADVDRRLIEKINLDTMERTVVMSSVNHPYDMAFFNGFLYWTEWGTETLKVASLGVAHSSPHLVHSFIHFPYGIALNHPMTQPHISSPCDKVNCPWVCVNVVRDFDFSSLDSKSKLELEAVCMCPDEYDINPKYNETDPKSVACLQRKDDDGKPVQFVTSHYATDLAKAKCDSMEQCSGHGKCADVGGKGVDRVECVCEKGWAGVWCEYEEPRSEKRTGDGDDEEGESGFGFGSFLLCLLLLCMMAGVVYLIKEKRDEIGSVTRRTMNRVQESRLPERAANAIKGSASRVNGRRAEREESPALFHSRSEEEERSRANNFENPVFNVRNSAVLPYSGLNEMNNSDPSFFHVEGHDDHRLLP